MEDAALGLKRGTVKIVPYNPAWVQAFEKEKQALTEMFGDRILAIEHVGSTAVQGLSAKPIIDINASISSLTDVRDFMEKLPSLGYVYLPKRSYPIPEFAYRHLFIKGPEWSRTHHLKLIEQGQSDWGDNILFRDYLRTNAEARNTYAALKQELALKYADDRESYTESKAEFIQDILHRLRETSRVGSR